MKKLNLKKRKSVKTMRNKFYNFEKKNTNIHLDKLKNLRCMLPTNFFHNGCNLFDWKLRHHRHYSCNSMLTDITFVIYKYAKL